MILRLRSSGRGFAQRARGGRNTPADPNRNILSAVFAPQVTITS